MTNKQKCCCKVFDKLPSRKLRVCRANVWNEFGGKKYCYSHAKKFLAESATIIQKYKRGCRSRQIINNIYINLPTEIQRIIDKYINEELQIKKQINIINKIIFNRFKKIDNQVCEIHHRHHHPVDDNTDWFMKYFKICKNISGILNILTNNWHYIHLIYQSQLNEPFLVKLFTLARHGIWGTTIWNGISLEGLTNYINAVTESSTPHMFESFTSNYFEELSIYWNLFVNTFQFTRLSTIHYKLSILHMYESTLD
jgi:hypothetical protein